MIAVGTFMLNGAANAACPLNRDCPPPYQKGEMGPPPGDEMGPPPPPHFKQMSPQEREKWKKDHEKRKAEFDSRLKLTDAQKKQIEQNRIESHKKMKPVFEEMKAKKMKIQEIQASTLSQEEKEKQTCSLRAEVKNLKMQLRQFREANMKAFEDILTEPQKKEFAKIKEEHKKKMDKKFKGKKPPFPPPSEQ